MVRAVRARDDAGRPNAPFLATGTMAGAIDLSFSDKRRVWEIFSTDYASMETEMESVGRAVPSTERFHRLVWGCWGAASEETRLGLIAGGLVDGTVNVYNPAKIVDGATSGAIVTKLAKHQGAVRGLDLTRSRRICSRAGRRMENCVFGIWSEPFRTSLYPALKSTTGDRRRVRCRTWGGITRCSTS